MDVDYDEDVGNPAVPECLISISRNEELYEMTTNVFPWAMPADGDASRRVVPLAYLESMVRRAPVDRTADLSSVLALTRCLHLHDFLVPTITLLLENGVGESDDDGDDGLVVYESLHDLYERCDAVMNSLKEDPTVQVVETSFDYYEDLGAGHAHLQWLDPLTMDSLVARTNDVSLYIELNLILGPRALDGTRMQPGSQLRMVAGSATGGSLAAALRVHFNLDADVEAVFLADQIADFLFETRWEPPYDIAFKSMKEYALAPRGSDCSGGTQGKFVGSAMSRHAIALRLRGAGAAVSVPRADVAPAEIDAQTLEQLKKKLKADFDAGVPAKQLLEAALDAGVPATQLFEAALSQLVGYAHDVLGLEHSVVNEALDAEMVTVHEETDISKLEPALRDFAVLAEDDKVKEAAESAQAAGAQAALVKAPDDETALQKLRDAHQKLASAYSEAVTRKAELDDLFRKAADAVVAGGDSFRLIYTSVWGLVHKVGVSAQDDAKGEGVLDFKKAVRECLDDALLKPTTSMVELQGMADNRDAGEYMRNAAKVMVPFGEMVAKVVEDAQVAHGFKVVSCKKPKVLKKLERIVEKVALRPEKDGCIAVVCDCVRMMVPVRKMVHIAHLLRAFCDRDAVKAIAAALGVDRFELVRAKERFFDSPSAGGWRDLMLNFLIVVGDARQVCELQIVHDTMLSARAGLPGHAIYNRVRNASELVEYQMGAKIAMDALRLAALRVAIDDRSVDSTSFPERLDKLAVDKGKLRLTFNDKVQLTGMELVETQIPNQALDVLLGALGDGAWGQLAHLPLVHHEMSEEDVGTIIKSGILRERRLNVCGMSDVVEIQKMLTVAECRLVGAMLEADAPVPSIKCVCYSPTIHEVPFHLKGSGLLTVSPVPCWQI